MKVINNTCLIPNDILVDEEDTEYILNMPEVKNIKDKVMYTFMSRVLKQKNYVCNTEMKTDIDNDVLLHSTCVTNFIRYDEKECLRIPKITTIYHPYKGSISEEISNSEKVNLLIDNVDFRPKKVPWWSDKEPEYIPELFGISMVIPFKIISIDIVKSKGLSQKKWLYTKQDFQLQWQIQIKHEGYGL